VSQGRNLLLEDEVIYFLPNIPSRADKKFHETGVGEKSFCLEVAVRDTPRAIPMDANLVPLNKKGKVVFDALHNNKKNCPTF
jgi:hypothetical protein